MKNFMYLPILAVLFLFACKSNSFTTQRYTHYDNKAPGSSLKKPAAHAKKPATSAYVACASGPNSHYISDVFDTYTKPVEEAAAEKANAKQHTAAHAAKSCNGLHSMRAGSPVKILESSAQRVIRAGMKQQSKAARHGLIFGIINLALFIVLCVIFVAGVIFLVMLLAV